MNKALPFLLILHFFHLRSFSQENLIVCNWEKNPDNSYSIYADSRAYGDYTVKLSFQTLTGYNTSMNRGYFMSIGTGRTLRGERRRHKGEQPIYRDASQGNNCRGIKQEGKKKLGW